MRREQSTASFHPKAHKISSFFSLSQFHQPPTSGWDGSSCVDVTCSTCMYYDPSYGESLVFCFPFFALSLFFCLLARRKTSKHSSSLSFSLLSLSIPSQFFQQATASTPLAARERFSLPISIEHGKKESSRQPKKRGFASRVANPFFFWSFSTLSPPRRRSKTKEKHLSSKHASTMSYIRAREKERVSERLCFACKPRGRPFFPCCGARAS